MNILDMPLTIVGEDFRAERLDKFGQRNGWLCIYKIRKKYEKKRAGLYCVSGTTNIFGHKVFIFNIGGKEFTFNATTDTLSGDNKLLLYFSDPDFKKVIWLTIRGLYKDLYKDISDDLTSVSVKIENPEEILNLGVF